MKYWWPSCWPSRSTQEQSEVFVIIIGVHVRLFNIGMLQEKLLQRFYRVQALQLAVTDVGFTQIENFKLGESEAAGQ